jgi:hypothetical protein
LKKRKSQPILEDDYDEEEMRNKQRYRIGKFKYSLFNQKNVYFIDKIPVIDVSPIKKKDSDKKAKCTV